MSRETSTWLNTNTLIGCTESRGNAWHYRAEEQGEESNHYPGFIPVEDVQRRLFHWSAVGGPVETTVLTDEGVIESYSDDTRLVVVRPDTRAVLGVHKAGYSVHQFSDWLLGTVATILDGDLGVSSAGLLTGGARAWVEVSVPDTVTTPEGVTFRGNLLACTSHDGSLATTFKRTITNTVCDNTMGVALSEDGEQVKVRHSKHSGLRAIDARNALNLVQTVSDDFAAEVKALCETTVNDKQWSEFLAAAVPLPEQPGRGATVAEKKRDSLHYLWKSDPRVAPWTHTAWGVVQAVNTYGHHVASVKGGTDARAERNAGYSLSGKWDDLDANTLKVLQTVLA